MKAYLQLNFMFKHEIVMEKESEQERDYLQLYVTCITRYVTPCNKNKAQNNSQNIFYHSFQDCGAMEHVFMILML